MSGASFHFAFDLRQRGAALLMPAPRGVRVRCESKKAEADRRMFRLTEDDCPDAQAATSRGGQSALDLYSRLRSLQSGAYAKPSHRSSGGVRSTFATKAEQRGH